MFGRGESKKEKRREKRSCGWIGAVAVVGAVIGDGGGLITFERERECRG